MSRLAIYTGGRTGSSAIREELNNHPKIICHGEIFRPNPLIGPGVQMAFSQFGKDYPTLGKTRDKVLPFRLHSDLGPTDTITAELFTKYWDFLDASISDGLNTVVGGKILYNHILDTQFFDLAENNNIYCLILRRRNKLRQAVSAIVAKTLKIHNRTNYTPEEGRSFTIDPNQIVDRLKVSTRKMSRHDEALASSTARYQVVYYEDWVADRTAFFTPIFKALNLPFYLPEGTTFSRTTPEPLSDLLDNYAEVERAVTKAGFADFLIS